MTKVEEIEEEFSSRATITGGLLFFRPADAISVVLRCRDEGVTILGIDGFLLHTHGTQPVMEHSIDFSSEQSQSDQDTYKSAIRFLKDRENSEYYFELALGD